MNNIEFEELKIIKNAENCTLESLISIDDFPVNNNGEKYTGTLMYGYKNEFEMLHVYAKYGNLNILIYNKVNKKKKIHIKGNCVKINNELLKGMIYIEETQFFFALLLRNKNISLDMISSGKNAESVMRWKFIKRALVL